VLKNRKKWFIGDRVSGKYMGRPFIGSIELCHNNVHIAYVYIDLPLIINDAIIQHIKIDSRKLKALVQY
jgi:N-acetylglucosamine kinase-like BadF-type ATPase